MYQTTGTGSGKGGSGHGLRLLVAGLGAVLPVLAFFPAPAGASPATGSPSAAPQHCAVEVTKGSSEPSKVKCFATLTEAIKFATRGAITNAPASVAGGANAAALDALLGGGHKTTGTAKAAAVSTIFGIEYDDANYGPGASLTFYGTVACTGPTTDVDYQISLPTNWYDRISSYQTFNNCYANHYYLQNYGGQATGYSGGLAVMPTVGGINFNNNARSIRWS